jgi:hypothetical protein
MGMTLEHVLENLKDLREDVNYFLNCIGYTATDIDNLIGDLEQKLKDAKRETND